MMWLRFALCLAGFLVCFLPKLLPAQQPKLTKEQLEKLFKDVKLPEGDPLPDHVEREWRPPNADTSRHNKRGTDYGPAVAFTLQLAKDQWIRRGFTIRLPEDHTVCYDLDTLALAASWQGGFIDFSETHFEDAKGKYPGRPGGTPTLWVYDAPGWADGQSSLTDPRPGKLGALPAEQVKYNGHFLHGYHVILSYQVLGRSVLEMPGIEKARVGNRTPLTRTFHIAAGERPIRLLVAAGFAARLADNTSAAEKAVVFAERGKEMLAAWVIGAPAGSRWLATPQGLALEMAASKSAVNCRLAFVIGHAIPVDKVTAAARAADPPMDLRNWIRGGKPRWKQALVTKGSLGPNDRAYTVDTLTLPVDNPYKSWLRPAGLDFFSDGRLAWASLNGDVWIVSGIDDRLENLTWRRYATGLYEPLGLKIVNDQLYVLGRDRISRLHDLNGDGEADFYESFHAGGVTSPGYHAFSFDLHTDRKGNFYYVKSGRKADNTPDHNALLRISPDGKKWEAVAHGFRHPNGMGIGPNNEIVVSDNQGEWVPASKVSLIREGGFYGYGKSDKPYQRPLFWLPMDMDNSSGGQLWAGPRWGPLSGKLLHTSYGTCKLFYVLTQMEADSPVQATVIPFDLTFVSGIMRGRVNPVDGQVYLGGLKGWQTTGKHDGCLQRVRWTGQSVCLVQNVTVAKDSIRLTFNSPVNFQAASNAASYKLEQWNYIFSEKYGSPEMSVANPAKKGRDPVSVKLVNVNNDHRQVILHLPGLRPVDQLRLQVNLRSAAGEMVQQDLYITLHRVP